MLASSAELTLCFNNTQDHVGVTSAKAQANTLCYFTAILEQGPCQTPPLYPSRTPRLHPTGNRLQGRHLRCPYLGLSQTLASSLVFYPPLSNIYPFTNPATDPILMRLTTKPEAVAHHSIWLVSTFIYFPPSNSFSWLQRLYGAWWECSMRECHMQGQCAVENLAARSCRERKACSEH